MFLIICSFQLLRSDCLQPSTSQTEHNEHALFLSETWLDINTKTSAFIESTSPNYYEIMRAGHSEEMVGYVQCFIVH